MVEIEVKIRINDISAIGEKILNLGTSVEKQRFLEENTLYDFRSKELERKQQALRLRKINKKILLTFKGPPQKSRRFKIREEYETEVRNEKQLKKILKSLGLQPAFSYQKFRTIYRKKNLKVCLDETHIGNFMELEGERNEIVKFAKALGLSKNKFIKLDYIQLMKKEGEQK
jgi:predicted adenylyl cyclase CyaB